MRILRQTLRDARRTILGFAIGVVAFTALIAATYPAVKAQSAQFEQIAKTYPPAMRAFFGGLDTIGTGPGYVQAEVFGATFPILMLVLAIGRGSDAIAGEEERGSLEGLLALPLPRSRLVLEKAGALAIALLAVVGAEAAALLAADAALGMGIGAPRLLVACLAMLLLALAFGAIAMALGAATGRRGLAIGVAAALAAASFLLNGLAAIADRLAPLRVLSLHHHFDRAVPLTKDGQPLGLLVLALVAIAAIAVALWAFERRDVGVA